MTSIANNLQIAGKDNFRSINKGYDSVFKTDQISIGLVVPIERYDASPVPTMQNHLARVQLAEELGFKSVWLRDVPFNVPSFGDAGQVFDPFVYLGYLAAKTKKIALGVSSIVLPLRHPAHVAKAAASTDVLSEGRLILGVASGDRPEEYPALNMTYDDRGERFRESYDYIRAMAEDYPDLKSQYGSARNNIDMLPKPIHGEIPMLITGGSQQSPEWIAANGDGWMLYPRNPLTQAKIISEWRERIAEKGGVSRPVMEPLYIDLTDDPDTPPQPIHLGLRLGAKYLNDYLAARQEIGVNHVALNLRFNQSNIEKTMDVLAQEVLSNFHQQKSKQKERITEDV